MPSSLPSSATRYRSVGASYSTTSPHRPLSSGRLTRSHSSTIRPSSAASPPADADADAGGAPNRPHPPSAIGSSGRPRSTSAPTPPPSTSRMQWRSSAVPSATVRPDAQPCCCFSQSRTVGASAVRRATPDARAAAHSISHTAAGARTSGMPPRTSAACIAAASAASSSDAAPADHVANTACVGLTHSPRPSECSTGCSSSMRYRVSTSPPHGSAGRACGHRS